MRFWLSWYIWDASLTRLMLLTPIFAIKIINGDCAYSSTGNPSYARAWGVELAWGRINDGGQYPHHWQNYSDVVSFQDFQPVA